MAIPQSGPLLRHLRQTVLRHNGAGLTDGQLLRSFLHRRDEAAFEALVRRHGPMVRGVCRRVLRDSHDADDAFQAAFLVLLRKASTLATREVVGDWLHGVAYRTALKARAAAARRRIKERQTPRREAILDEETQTEWRPLLDQEIGRLPEKYRTPLVLCDLEGRTHKEAAQQLGWPEGTLSGRLSRARAMLARRLTRRGITLSAGALGVGLAGEASACLPFSLVGSTCKAAMEFAAGSAVSVVPAHVAALTEGVVKAMLFSKVKKIAAAVMAALILTAGVGAWRYAAAGAKEERPRENPALPAPRTDAAHAPKEEPLRPIPPADRGFQINLKIVEKKNGQEKLLAEPQMRTVEGTPVSIVTSPAADSRTIDLGGGKTEKVALGLTVHFVVRQGRKGKIRMDLTLSKSTEAIFGDTTMLESKSVRQIADVALGEKTQLLFSMSGKPPSVLVISAMVREVKQTVEKTVAEAERDLKMAENWRKKGRPEVACGYYLQIIHTYPDTIYAERAKERLAELRKIKEKPPARVGQIFITGNKTITDKVILEHVKLYPGQILTFPDLRIAEQNLSRIKGLKGQPKVTVLDREGAGEFKDIQITVEEK